MTHFDKLIELATEARKLHQEGKLGMCWNTLFVLSEYVHKVEMQVQDERMAATYEVKE